MSKQPKKSSAKPIRVAHLIGHLNFGGAENQVVMLVNHLDSRLFVRHVITMTDIAQGFRDDLDDSVFYYCIDYRRRTAPAGLFRLYKYLRRNRIDILHCHMYHAGVKGALTATLAGVPIVLVSEHGKNAWKNAWHRWVERNIVTPLIECRLAVSEDIRQLRIKDGIPPKSIKTITNAVDTTMQPRDRSAKPVNLGALGRLIDAKDYGVLIRAMACLRDAGYSLTLEIAGDGPERDHLRSLIVEESLDNRVRLVGFQDAGGFLKRIDMFVMSSKREGVPVSLLEAMAYGLPIVATRVGGIPEVLADGVEGTLCKPGDPAGLAQAIAALVDDDSQRIAFARSARKRAERNYGIHALADNMTQMYRELLSGHQQR